jgi:hypothetical protein
MNKLKYFYFILKLIIKKVLATINHGTNLVSKWLLKNMHQKVILLKVKNNQEFRKSPVRYENHTNGTHTKTTR